MNPTASASPVALKGVSERLSSSNDSLRIEDFRRLAAGSFKILITGGTGFIGSHIVERLISAGFDVVCFVRKESNLRWLKDKLGKIELRYGDFLYPETLTRTFDNVNTVIHAAGLVNTYDWHNFYLINFLGTKNILQACKDAGSVKNFIFFSSQTACGPSGKNTVIDETCFCKPVSHFGKSKLLAEEEVLKFKEDFNVTILRPTLIYGPRDTTLNDLFRFMKKGMFVSFGSFEKTVNLCFVEDLVDGVIKILDSRRLSGEIYFLGGDNYPFYEVKDTFSKVLGKHPKVITLPELFLPAVSCVFDLIGRVLKRPFVLNRDRIDDLKQTNWGVCIEKAKKELDYSPTTSLHYGIKKTYEWYVKAGMV